MGPLGRPGVPPFPGADMVACTSSDKQELCAVGPNRSCGAKARSPRLEGNSWGRFASFIRRQGLVGAPSATHRASSLVQPHHPQLVLFSHSLEGENPTGNSLLRLLFSKFMTHKDRTS